MNMSTEKAPLNTDSNLENHPSVIAYKQRTRNNKPEAVSGQWIKEMVIEAGADDVGVVTSIILRF